MLRTIVLGCLTLAWFSAVAQPKPLKRLTSGKNKPKSFFQPVPVSLRPVTVLPWSLYESSGIVVPHPNKIWSHEDSGNDNLITCIDTLGNVLRTITVVNAKNVDWEELAADNQGRIYIGDFGNNNNNRKDLVIYRISDPEKIQGNSTTAEIIAFTYEDQAQFPPPPAQRNYDMEAMVWLNDTLHLFSKNRTSPQNGYCKHYTLPSVPGKHIARLVDSIFLGTLNEQVRVTAADLHPVTGELVLLTATRILSFTGYPGNRFFDGTLTEYVFTNTPGQVEAIAFVAPNRLYVTEEGSGASTGNLYEVTTTPSGVSQWMLQPIPFDVFPNPASGMIRLKADETDSLQLAVYNAFGEKLLQVDFMSDTTIDISSYSPGTYFITVTDGYRTSSRRITKR